MNNQSLDQELSAYFEQTIARYTNSPAAPELADILARYVHSHMKTERMKEHADLVWCLGKLRGLGHPAEHLEAKYLSSTQGEKE